MSICRFGRIAPAPNDPSREQVSDRSEEPTVRAARTGPFATDVKFNSLTDWIGEIQRLWARGNCATLELARIVSAARNALARGEWTALWNSARMPSIIPFSKRKGEMLVAIGDGLGWANAHECAHLPGGLRTLCYLAKLDRITLERLIQEGVIHPKLKESEARQLAARFRGSSVETESRKLQVQQWLRRCSEFVRANVKYWRPEERELATEGLAHLIEEIGGPFDSEQAAHAVARSSVRNDLAAAVAARFLISPRMQTI